MATSKPRIVVLISGSGTNLQALIDAASGENARLNADLVKVISSNPDAYGLERASSAGIPTITHSLSTYYVGEASNASNKTARKEAREKFNLDLAQLIVKDKPDLVVCAGWMLILSANFLETLRSGEIPIINLHPALPGQFSGIKAIERAWEAGRRGEITKSGIMIHEVIPQVDMGEPIVVKEMDIRPHETLQSYEDRVHALEHEAIVQGTITALSRKSPI